MPELDGKHYAYTEEGKAQYKRDKIRLGMQEGGEPVMEEIVVKAKAPPKKEIRRNRRNDFWENAGSKVWEGAKLVSNPASYIGGKLLSEYMRSQRNKDDASGVGEAETGEPKTRQGMQVGGPTEEQMSELMPEEDPIEEEIPEETLETQEFEEEYQEEELVPDEEMEGDYMEFIIEQSLAPEDEQYLLTKLNEDPRLSMIFDNVVETASEFAGSGPVEGPGTPVSDSIPARLSDGEFVMTSKAANQIGPDNLQGMMEQAEMDADENERQIMQAGGYAEEEEEDESIEDEDLRASVKPVREAIPESLVDRELKKAMLAQNPRYSLFDR